MTSNITLRIIFFDIIPDYIIDAIKDDIKDI